MSPDERKEEESWRAINLFRKAECCGNCKHFMSGHGYSYCKVGEPVFNTAPTYVCMQFEASR